MERTRLVAVVIGALLLSGTNAAIADGNSHEKVKLGHASGQKVRPISLPGRTGVLTIDTSTAVPKFAFDTSTVTSYIDLDDHGQIQFDTSTVTSQIKKDDHDEESGDKHDSPNSPLSTGTSITKPFAKSNDDDHEANHDSFDNSDD